MNSPSNTLSSPLGPPNVSREATDDVSIPAVAAPNGAPPSLVAASLDGAASSDAPNDTQVSVDGMYTQQQMMNISRIAEAAQEQFPATKPPTKYWDSREALQKELDQFAQHHGFLVSCGGSNFTCTMSDLSDAKKVHAQKKKEKTMEHKRRNRSSTRCGCQFKINFVRVKNNRTNQALFPDAPEKAVVITKGAYFHTNGCNPSRNQLVAQKKSSGVYSSMLQRDTLQALMKMQKHGHVPIKLLRGYLSDIYPTASGLSAMTCANARLKIKKFLETEGDLSDESLRQFVSEFPITERNELPLDMLETPEHLDEVSRNINNLLRDALKETGECQQIIHLLEEAAGADPGFKYRVAKNDDGELTGVVWQTPAMRRSFERFGDVMFLDCMKRQLNSLHWPYIGPALIDGEGKMCVACESIICTERLEAYLFVVNALYEMIESKVYTVSKSVDGVYSVRHRKFVNEPPLLLENNIPCTCSTKIAFPQAPCEHEVAVDSQKFVYSRWKIRYHHREKLDVSRDEPVAGSGVVEHPVARAGGDLEDYHDHFPDDDLDDSNMTVRDTETEEAVCNSRPTFSQINRRPTYSQIMSTLREFAEAVQHHPDCEKYLGLVVEMTNSAKNKEHQQTHTPPEQLFRESLNAFASTNTNTTLFSQTGDAGTMRRGASIAPGRPRHRRLQSQQEQNRRRKPPPPSQQAGVPLVVNQEPAGQTQTSREPDQRP